MLDYNLKNDAKIKILIFQEKQNLHKKVFYIDCTNLLDARESQIF